MFADALGRPIRPGLATRWFGSRREAAGIPTGDLHTLRHTCATLALTGSPPVPPVPLHIVARRLGDHEVTILRTYSHLLPQSDEAAAQAVAAQLAPTSR